jgi:hypothetical protein
LSPPEIRSFRSPSADLISRQGSLSPDNQAAMPQAQAHTPRAPQLLWQWTGQDVACRHAPMIVEDAQSPRVVVLPDVEGGLQSRGQLT